jgi:uncharacterized membrane protein
MDSNLLIGIIISVIFIVLITFDFFHRKVYNELIFSAIGILMIMMIWVGLIPVAMVIIPIIIMAFNVYIITRENK